MPLAVAFALAAVLSPTDPIAVSAIAQRVPISRRTMRILEGESLLNDASGLVCFRLAVAALLTGTFSLSHATFEFGWLVTGCIGVGAGLTWLLCRLKNEVSRLMGEESGAQILISVLTMNFVEASSPAPAITRIRRNTFWDVIQFSANGVIFVLLGEQLHGIVAAAATTVTLTGHTHPAWLVAYVLAISLGLAVLRSLWVYVSLRLTLFRSRESRGKPGRIPVAAPTGPPVRLGARLVAVMTLAGVRGAVTLAAVMSLPLALPDGSAFPARDLAILLAMGVITVSLVAASIGLPLLLKGLTLPVDPSLEAEEALARVTAAHAAIAEIERLEEQRPDDHAHAEVILAAARVIDSYRARIESRTGDHGEVELARRGEAFERELRVAGLMAERTELFANCETAI